MENGKHFIVIKELKSTSSDTGNIVTEEFDLRDIKNTLGENISIVETKINIDNNSKIHLMLTCKKNIPIERKAPSEPLIKTY